MPAQVLPFRRPEAAVAPAPAYDSGDPELDALIPSLTSLRQQYIDYIGTKTAENAEAAEARRYYHGAQWTRDELNVLRQRRQSPTTFNRESRRINGIVGLVEKLRQDPKAFPVTPSPQAADGAELATTVLNQALEECRFPDTSPEVWRNVATGGIGGCELVMVPGDRGDPTVDWREVDQRDFFYDPRSTKGDFSDCRYMGTSKWVDLEVAQDMFPDLADELTEYIERAPAPVFEHGDERDVHWVDLRGRRIRLVDHWLIRQDKWIYCLYAGELIIDAGWSPHFDEHRKSVCKYVMASCYVDHENDRYGFHRGFKSAQDEINHRHSKALNALNTRRIEAEKGAFDDPELARREAARLDGFVERNKGYEANIVANEFDLKGHAELMQAAMQEIDNFGPSTALAAQNIDPKSGRALMLLQQAGIAELGPFMIGYRSWKLRVYRMTWAAIQQFWSSERWIRVTDDQGLTQFIQVNGWQKDQFGFPVMLNQLSALDVDIVLDEGPDQVNSMADAFDTMLALMQGGANVPPEVIIELSALPSSIKRKVMGFLMQSKQPDPIAQQAMQIKLQQEAAKIPKTQSETVLNEARAQAAQAAAMAPPTGPAAQVDTPADMAKAAKDMAQAHQISAETQKTHSGADTAIKTALDLAKIREAHARALKLETEAAYP